MTKWKAKEGPMNRGDALTVVRQICCGPAENTIITPLLEILQRAFPHADVSDLIFHNPVELTPEQVVDEVIKRELDYARQAATN